MKYAVRITSMIFNQKFDRENTSKYYYWLFISYFLFLVAKCRVLQKKMPKSMINPILEEHAEQHNSDIGVRAIKIEVYILKYRLWHRDTGQQIEFYCLILYKYFLMHNLCYIHHEYVREIILINTIFTVKDRHFWHSCMFSNHLPFVLFFFVVVDWVSFFYLRDLRQILKYF